MFRNTLKLLLVLLFLWGLIGCGGTTPAGGALYLDDIGFMDLID